MQKQAWTWTNAHLPQPARMARWGHFGTPVLIFPTAGGDFEEIERFQLVSALGSLIDGGRIKAYSVDALAVRARLSGATSIDERYDSFLYEDVLKRIRSDCQDERIEPLLVGASLGAGTALRTLCRHPDAFRGAIGMSGVYRDGRDCSNADGVPATISGGAGSSAGSDGSDGGRASIRAGAAMNAAAANPSATAFAFLTALTVAQIEQLKGRAITLGTGAGDYENPIESKLLADALGAKGIPCRFSNWGPQRSHTWSTWRDLLPGLL